MSQDHRNRLARAIEEVLTRSDWEGALPLLEEWCQHFPDHAQGWLRRGECLLQL